MDAKALELLRRNSGLTLDAEGIFSSHGRRVANARVQALFHRGLAIRANGDVTLSVGEVWAYVETESVARFVTHLTVDDEILRITFMTGETVESMNPRLDAGPDHRFYLRENAEAYPAVLLRPAHMCIGNTLDERDGIVGFALGARWKPIHQLSKVPGPAG